MKLDDLPVGLLPIQIVQQAVQLPFPPYPYQVKVINELAPLQRHGEYAEVGTGKTLMSTVIAIFHLLMGMADQFLVIVPPVLIRQWVIWLNSIEPGIAIAYRGTPAARNKLKLDAKFIVLSTQIFKKDIERFKKHHQALNLGGIVDEATCIKNVDTGNYKAVRDFFAGQSLFLLTGTPLTTPIDAYAYIKLLAPNVYKTKAQFENVHVEGRDFFGNVTSWQNLDVLTENFKINTVRLLQREVLKDLPEVIYTPVHYDLEGKHLKLYRQLAEEQLVLLESGGKIDATTESGLYQKLQQIVMNPGYFAQDPEMRPTGLDLLDEVLAQAQVLAKEGWNKILIVTWYRRTSLMLHEYLNGTAPGSYKGATEMIIGGLTDKQRDKALERFVNDPTCRAMVVQPGAAGKGTDGLQRVCNDMIFMEFPPTAVDFEQMVGRLARNGQTRRPNVRLAVAEGTVQHKLWSDCMTKQSLANRVQRGFKDLRDAVYGG